MTTPLSFFNSFRYILSAHELLRGAIRIPLRSMLMPRCRAMHPIRNSDSGEQAPLSLCYELSAHRL